MPNPYFQFKQFTIRHNKCAMKVGTDGVLLGAWVNTNNAASILDIGTGTGLIALMLAQRSSSTIDAVEIDTDAFLQAGENIEQSPWANQIAVYNTSFQQFALSKTQKYDLIVSNPPYFKNSLKAFESKRNVARHSDLLPYNELLKGVANLLNDSGRFCIILPYIEAQIFIVDAALSHLYCTRKTNIKPSARKKEYRVLTEFSKIRTRIEECTLSILDINGSYTREYKELTKEYYLNF